MVATNLLDETAHDALDHTGLTGVGGGGPTELDYTEFTSPVSVTATVEALADTVVTAGAETFDGSTIVLIEFYSPGVTPNPAGTVNLWLYDGTSIGLIASVVDQQNTGITGASRSPVRVQRRLTPSAAAHTYSIRATTSAGTATVNGGAGGAGAYMPGHIRITTVVTG